MKDKSTFALITTILKVKRQEEAKATKITLHRPATLGLLPGQYVEVSSTSNIKTAIALAALPTKKNPDTFKLCIAEPPHIITEKQKLKWMLFHDAQAGTEVRIKGALGVPLPLQHIANKPLLLIAAGSGLASMHSIFARITNEENTQILYCARSYKNLLFLKKVHQFKENPKNFISLTQESRAGFHQGRLNAPLEQMFIAPGTQVFICGPEEFMQDMVRILLNKRLDPHHIYVILNKFVPKKEHLGPVFRLDELQEEEFFHTENYMRSKI